MRNLIQFSRPQAHGTPLQKNHIRFFRRQAAGTQGMRNLIQSSSPQVHGSNCVNAFIKKPWVLLRAFLIFENYNPTPIPSPLRSGVPKAG
jgi:hypothetical protein